MDLGLNGRAALVAASSRGLGRAVAERLAAEGCRVCVSARSSESLSRVADEIRARTGVEVHAVPCDLTDPAQIERLVADASERFGGIDILVTNAGGPPTGTFESLDLEAWRRAVQLNLESVIVLCRAVLTGMRERGWGRIVNVTSISVKQPVDGLVLSNSVRAAVTGLARTLANEVAPAGITVNNVLPGYTATERVTELATAIAERDGGTPEAVTARWEAQIPMGRIGRPEEFAAAVAFLASEPAGYITAQSLAVDGGWIRGLF